MLHSIQFVIVKGVSGGGNEKWNTPPRKLTAVDNQHFCRREKCERPTHERRVLIIESVLAIVCSSIRTPWVALSLISDRERVVGIRHLTRAWSSQVLKSDCQSGCDLHQDQLRSELTKWCRDSRWVTSRLVSGFAETDSIGPRQILQRELSFDTCKTGSNE